MFVDDFVYWVSWLQSAPEERKRLAQQRHWDRVVQPAMKRVLAKTSNREPRVFNNMFFGATGIDPQHLSIWYIFATDAQLKESEINGLADELRGQTKAELQAGGYPLSALSEICISFASQEDIERTADGDYHEYFQ